MHWYRYILMDDTGSPIYIIAVYKPITVTGNGSYDAHKWQYPLNTIFPRYTILKFWSRDYHVIMTSQKFLIWSSKCPVYQPFIWGAAIGRTFFGSLVIWLLNFGHVTTWSRDFFRNFLRSPLHNLDHYLQFQNLWSQNSGSCLVLLL